MLVAGILLAGFGFGIYYVMPLSLLSLNLALLLNLFVLQLVGMLLGMQLAALVLAGLPVDAQSASAQFFLTYAAMVTGMCMGMLTACEGARRLLPR